MILVAKEVKKVTVWRGSTRLPSEYQEVEYIQSSGTQSINTGVYMNPNYTVEVKYQLSAFNSNYATIFGCRRGNYEKFVARFRKSDGTLGLQRAKNTTAAGENKGDYSGYYDSNIHTIKMNRYGYIDDTLLCTFSSSTFTGNFSITLYLFALNASELGTPIVDLAEMKLYSAKIYDTDGTTLIRNLIPCYRKADSVIGMYDLINDVFYTNEGTGTFAKGNDVGGLQEIQLRPRKWKPGANTLLYLPLENDFVDQSGQATTRTFTKSGLSYTTVGGVSSVHIGSSGGAKLTTPYPIQSDITKPLTISLRVYVTTQSSSSRRLILDMASTNGSWLWMALYENTSNVRVSFNNGDTTQASINGAIPSANSRFNIVATATAQSSNLYINGQLVGTGNGCQYPRGFRPYSHDNSQGIFCTRDVNRYSQALNGNARELIMEQIEWTAQEVASYYSQIKAKLGI